MPFGQAPTGTVTLLFSDIEGSTKLWEVQPEAMRVSLARHDALMRQAIGSHNGYVFKTIGDAFCAAFWTASDAVEAVLEAQLALTSEPWPGETPLKVRMALHTGAVECREDDYFGAPVNRVARLLATVHGGQSVLSQTTYDLVRDTLPPDVRLVDLGIHQLKDLARPEHVFQMHHPSLRAEFPTLRSLSNQPNNLPLQLTSFVGREAEIEQVKTQFETCRIVTLSGAGGSGKTRLSLQIAAELLEDFPDGVWLVELATVNDSGQVWSAVAGVLGIQERRDHDLTSTLVEQIRSKKILIILDNCEHLVESCARLADLMLKSCPELKFITTSREALGIAGEVTFRVPPLEIPTLNVRQTPATLSHFAAVRLFIDRAVQAAPGFLVTNENAPALASVCRHLDGIPLAIELAAARIRSLSVDQIEARLVQRFSLLTGGSRVALPRQQTMRALIDWSYDLLQPDEKSVLQRLSVFSGGCDLESAEDVCSDGEIVGWQVSENLLALVDKSLVSIHELGAVRRYLLLESIRDYARERLLESAQSTVYADRHFDYFFRLVRSAAPQMRGPEQRTWLTRLDMEWDNILAALGHGIDTHDGLEMAGHLWWYWFFRGHFTQGRALLTMALSKNPGAPPEARIRALGGAGVLAEQQGDYPKALEFHQECLRISQEIGDRLGLAMSFNAVGNVYGNQAQYDSAETYWKQAFAIWQDLEAEGDPATLSGLAAALDNLGNVAFSRGQFVEARDYYLQGYEKRVRYGNPSLAAYSLVNLGTAEIKLGNYTSALAHFHQGLSISHDLKDLVGIGYFLFGLAELAEPKLASRLLGRFDQLRDDIEICLNEEERASHDALVEKLHSALTPDEFEDAWSEGRSMDLDQAVQEALQIEFP